MDYLNNVKVLPSIRWWLAQVDRKKVVVACIVHIYWEYYRLLHDTTVSCICKVFLLDHKSLKSAHTLFWYLVLGNIIIICYRYYQSCIRAYALLDSKLLYHNSITFILYLDEDGYWQLCPVQSLILDRYWIVTTDRNMMYITWDENIITALISDLARNNNVLLLMHTIDKIISKFL